MIRTRKADGVVLNGTAPLVRQRGLVTIELAIGILTAVTVMVTLVSMILVGAAWSAASSAAATIARHHAAGDLTGERQARSQLPSDSSVAVDETTEGVSVEVTVTPEVLGLGQITVNAQSYARWEPGQAPS